jgi:K(+)-stimulated pyrophosphate-energized sodium pump
MLGYSLIAIFNRAGGGIFTKMMDAAADFAGKNRHNLDEDSKENPGVIGDSVGDNVNDVLGNCSDLGESTMATLGGAIMIAYMFYKGCAPNFITALVIFAIGVNALGLIGSLIGGAFVLLHKSSGKPSRELDLSTWISALFVLAASFVGSHFLFSSVELPSGFNSLAPAFCAATGILSGIIVGKLTEHYTGLNGKPVRAIAEAARRGTPFVISEGDALGFRSALLPTAIIGISIMYSNNVCGYYGIAVAAIGMLSFIANTISIDAFGPVSDNAGGIASGCKLDKKVREITDLLDALGNTTAAIGKGFAIGSAAFASITLFINYVNSYSPGVIEENLVSVENIVALFLGIATVGVFVDMLTRYTNKGGEFMTDIINRQLDNPEIINGTKAPDYETCIVQGTQYALKHMTPPALLALAAPAILGLLFGPGFIAAFLLGAIGVSILLAFFYGNSGGAFDNAKKFIEANLLKGEKKGGDAHKAAVNGDIVGDIRKDVNGVSLDILIKLMTTVAITLAAIFSEHHLF